MGKFIIKVFVALLLIFFISCTKQATDKSQKNESGKEQEVQLLKIAFVLSGFLGDKSFNDSANEGIQRAEKEWGDQLDIKVLESKNPADWESNVIAMAAEGYDLVVGVSSQFSDIIDQQSQRFSDTKFALIDGVVRQPNVVSTPFSQNEGSFLAGAAAALWTTQTDIKNVNPEQIIGWVGGVDIPVLQDFLIGYKQGAKYIDPDVKILVAFAGSFNDPLKGKELTLAQYDLGADIVMNVASGTGVGILEAAKEAEKYAIGVDLNQDNVYPGYILTSMLKRVDIASYTLIKSIVDHTYKGDSVMYMDAANGGVSLTDMTTMKSVLKEKFPNIITDKIADIAKKINTGEITVENYPGFERQ